MDLYTVNVFIVGLNPTFLVSNLALLVNGYNPIAIVLALKQHEIIGRELQVAERVKAVDHFVVAVCVLDLFLLDRTYG
jgi:hypothetical protein